MTGTGQGDRAALLRSLSWCGLQPFWYLYPQGQGSTLSVEAPSVWIWFVPPARAVSGRPTDKRHLGSESG